MDYEAIQNRLEALEAVLRQKIEKVQIQSGAHACYNGNLVETDRVKGFALYFYRNVLYLLFEMKSNCCSSAQNVFRVIRQIIKKMFE